MSSFFSHGPTQNSLRVERAENVLLPQTAQKGPQPMNSQTSTQPTTNSDPGLRRRVFSFFGMSRFRLQQTRLFDALMDAGETCIAGFVYFMGPCLIVLVICIVILMVYTFATVLLPMIQETRTPSLTTHLLTALHCICAAFLTTNVLFNYFFCVVIRHTGPKSQYDTVVRELADATGFVYPETPQQVVAHKRDLDDKLRTRLAEHLNAREESIRSGLTPPNASQGIIQRRGTSSSEEPSSLSTPESQPRPVIRTWMLLGPLEWGYCSFSHQPKPPRSHYDHVTKQLVLNFDHYCPWMFNAGA